MKKLVAIVILSVLAIGGAYLAGHIMGASSVVHENEENAPATQEQGSLFTCPMHPQIQLPQNEPCPICGMELVEKTRAEIEAALAAGPRGIAMSEEARALLEVEVAPVQRRFVVKELRSAGRVTLDQTRVRTVTARFAGRLDRLFVDFEGMRVRAGDHLAEIYSPELVTAQQELIEAHAALKSEKGEAQSEQGSSRTSELLREGRRRAFEAAQAKLRLWGLAKEQIDDVLESGAPRERLELRAPSSGVVLRKMRDEGDYVSEGSPIYRVADLSSLWVQLDVYEQDLPWVHYGQRVWVEADALPGEVLEGVVSYVAPTMSEARRAIPVRVNVDNSHGLLKPGMLARGRIHCRLAAGGRIMDARLAGKWISPMHPSVIKDGPGKCDVCGMPLVPAEELGYAAGELNDKPLVVPASAVLRTGTRAIVYVAVPNKEKPTYEGREIDLGARAGNWYLVQRGLSEGERVVVHGAFMIDSALQIDGKPSMMSIVGRGDDFTGMELAGFRASLRPWFDRYFAAQVLLSKDDVEAARGKAREMARLLEVVQDRGLPTAARELWRDEQHVLRNALAEAEITKELEAHRAVFEEVSRAALMLARSFGPVGDEPWFEAYCPMAFHDKGAFWLQREERILNPYEGSRMLHCGEVKETFALAGQSEEKAASASSESPAADSSSSESSGQKDEPSQRHDMRVLKPVFEAYLSLQERLFRDDLSGARLELGALQDELEASKRLDFPDAVQHAWSKARDMMLPACDKAASLGEIDEFRVPFEDMSMAMLAFVDAMGHPVEGLLARAHCPMAFQNKGASWLQRGDQVSNPYEGARMPRCGSIEKRYPASGEEK